MKAIFPPFLIKHYVTNVDGVEVYIHEFLSSTLVGDEWIAIRPDNFILLPMVYEADFAPRFDLRVSTKRRISPEIEPCPSVVVSSFITSLTDLFRLPLSYLEVKKTSSYN